MEPPRDPASPASQPSGRRVGTSREEDHMSRTLVIEEAVRIRRTPDEVWAVISDYSSDHLWRPGITEMTPDPPGPPAVGTRVHEALNTGGRSYVTDSTVTGVGPGMTYRFSGSGTTGGVEGSRTVAATGANEA